jgi:hypothetical protein
VTVKEAASGEEVGRLFGLEPGNYITDGRRLVEVRRLKQDGVIGEEGRVDVPDLTSIPARELRLEWRKVEFEPAELEERDYASS